MCLLVTAPKIRHDTVYLSRAVSTRIFDFYSREDPPFLPPRAPLLVHLPLRAKLLKDHLSVAATMGVGVVEAHFGEFNISRNGD
jgi:hypothetical protein